MVKQIILPLVGVALFIILVGLFVKKSSNMTLPTPAATAITVPAGTLLIGTKSINIEVADTPTSRANGLSGRASLDANSGMLFTFDKKDSKPTFWMRGLQFPLDIVWINDNKVVKIDKNLPAPANGTPDNQLQVYPSGEPVDYVLEVNGGFCDKNKVVVGDSVTLPSGL